VINEILKHEETKITKKIINLCALRFFVSILLWLKLLEIFLFPAYHWERYWCGLSWYRGIE